LCLKKQSVVIIPVATDEFVRRKHVTIVKESNKQSVVIIPVATDELEKDLEDAINHRNNILL